jgi:hypothetical protein
LASERKRRWFSQLKTHAVKPFRPGTAVKTIRSLRDHG